METFLRAFDPNLARRQLHDTLYVLGKHLGMDPATLPHTFDTEALLSFAQSLIRRREVRDGVLFLDLLERTGVAVALCGEEDVAERLFTRGLRSAREPKEQARFHYLIAHHIHFRRGRLAEAKKRLQQALAKTETQRNLKSRALLLLGRIARQTQDAEGAEAAYRQVLNSGVLEYRPLALQYMGILSMTQDRYEDAVALNRKAHAAMKRRGLTLAMMQVDADLSAFHLARGQYRLAQSILEDVVARNVELLDLNSAGNTYNNLAMAFHKQDKDAAARDAYLQALRFQAATGRKHHMATTYRNLGITLCRLRDAETAFAAFETAIALAEEIASPEEEFRSRTEALDAILRTGIRVGCVPGFVARCDDILRTSEKGLSQHSLRAYPRVLGKLVLGRTPARLARIKARGPSRLSTPQGRASLKRLTSAIVENEFEAKLSERIGSGLPGRHGPRPEQLRAFLMLFAGDYFQFKHYAREFPLSPARVKHQLRELCRRGIIELDGTRKAAKYSLAFHRT